MGLFERTTDLTLLVERCRKGDSSAWEALVDRFGDFVYSIARRYRLDSDESADVFQVTFQSLYASMNQIENPETLPKWLSVTASRACQKTVRLKGRTVSLQTESADLTEVLADEDANAEQVSIQACDARTVREALTKLGGRCAKLLGMLYLSEDPSYQEVSVETGIPVGAIGPTRARCLEKLKKMLDQAGFFV